MTRTRLLPMILAAVLSVCANTAVFSAAVYAAEADPPLSATENAEGEERRICSACGKTESRPIFFLSPKKPEEPVSSKETDNSNASEQRTEESGSNGPETAVSPPTDDQSQWILWMAVMQTALISLALQLPARRKNNGIL